MVRPLPACSFLRGVQTVPEGSPCAGYKVCCCCPDLRGSLPSGCLLSEMLCNVLGEARVLYCLASVGGSRGPVQVIHFEAASSSPSSFLSLPPCRMESANERVTGQRQLQCLAQCLRPRQQSTPTSKALLLCCQRAFLPRVWMPSGSICEQKGRGSGKGSRAPIGCTLSAVLPLLSSLPCPTQ